MLSTLVLANLLTDIEQGLKFFLRIKIKSLISCGFQFFEFCYASHKYSIKQSYG